MDSDLGTFDLCIVGGSIAGNYLCYLLSQTNLKIVVIEEHEEIGLPLQCAGIVSQKLANLIDLPHGLILNRVTVAKIISPSGEFIKLSGNEKPYILDRIALDRLFYDKIKDKKNINYYFGEHFRSFRYIKKNRTKFLLIETSKRRIKTKILVGCDGPLSTVGKILGVKNHIIYASQIRIKHDFNQNEAVMYFDPEWKELFGWIVPEGNNIYRIGLATSHNINQMFSKFLKKIGINKEKKIDQQGGIIPYGLMNKLAYTQILLLGDSAGQVKSTTGGGIIMLLIAAKYAAYCIKTCFKNDNFSKKTIKKFYEIPCRAVIGHQLKIHYLIRILLEKFTESDYKKLFQIIRIARIENKISLYGDMDFPKTLVFQMLKIPLFLSFLFKFILSNPELIIKLLHLIFFKGVS